MEACPSYRPWHDKQTGKTFLRPDTGKCAALLHFYFHRMRSSASIYLRVPTWSTVPRLQFYCNGHSPVGWPVNCRRKEIAFTAADETRSSASMTGSAPRELADALSPDLLHRVLDRLRGAVLSGARRVRTVIPTGA